MAGVNAPQAEAIKAKRSARTGPRPSKRWLTPSAPPDPAFNKFVGLQPANTMPPPVQMPNGQQIPAEAAGTRLDLQAWGAGGLEELPVGPIVVNKDVPQFKGDTNLKNGGL
jgi:hypothetical protein